MSSNATSTPAAQSGPDKKTQASTPGARAAQTVLDAGKGALDGVAGAFKATGEAASRGVDAVAGAQPATWVDKLKGFINTFSESGGVGNTLGGILGLGGAWFMGNFFGGGVMSTILTVALALPMMLVGSDTAGGWINGLLGKNKPPATTGQSTPSPAQGQNVSSPAVGATPAPTVTQNTPAQAPTGQALTNQEILAMGAGGVVNGQVAGVVFNPTASGTFTTSAPTMRTLPVAAAGQGRQ